MSETTPVLRKDIGLPRRNTIVLGDGFAPLAAALDAFLIVAVSVAAGVLYHLYSYGHIGIVPDYTRVGLLAAFFYVAPRAFQQKYDIAHTASDPAGLRRIFTMWNFAIFCVLVIGFVSKLTDHYSRGAVILFYFSGFLSLVLLRSAGVYFMRRSFERGWLTSKRLFLLGTENRVRTFRAQFSPEKFGLRIDEIEYLPEIAKDEDARAFSERVQMTLDRAVEKARRLNVDNVVLLLPWSDSGTIRACRETFLKVPAATVLGPEQGLGRALEAGMCRIGPATGLNLVRAPLSITEILAKRAIDLLVAIPALVVLAPALALLALLVRLDSPGPVFFRQDRHGFNQKPFSIYKFRTMRVTEDGDAFVQATRDDPRVTRLGRFLRRWNLDELPQVINVIKGEMSIVGPRPHALVHNHEFQNRIALYARRHNVKPGITGWAQVNGYRGQTDSDDKMRARVAHDLYYIDNWSVWFDIQIILMTAFSRRAFHNAL